MSRGIVVRQQEHDRRRRMAEAALLRRLPTLAEVVTVAAFQLSMTPRSSPGDSFSCIAAPGLTDPITTMELTRRRFVLGGTAATMAVHGLVPVLNMNDVTGSIQSEVRALLDKWSESARRKDIDRLMALYAPTACLSTWCSAPIRRSGRYPEQLRPKVCGLPGPDRSGAARRAHIDERGLRVGLADRAPARTHPSPARGSNSRNRSAMKHG
jgi:hypothetical protein